MAEKRKARTAAARRRARKARAKGEDDATGRTLEWRGALPALEGKPPAVAAWIAQELAEQERRYRRIAREMEALEKRRQLWIREFYQRIQDTGFYLHADVKRRIRPEAIPPLPKKVRVVF